MAKFSLITDKEEGNATLYFRVHRNEPYINWRFNSKVKVDIKLWNNANKTADKLSKFRRTEYGNGIFAKLDAISNAVDKIMERDDFSKDKIESVIDDIVLSEVRAIREQEQKRQEQERIKREKERQADRLNVVNFYNEFFAGISDGTIKHGNDTVYSKGSINVWKQFGEYLKGFCKERHVTFDSIDKSVADRFTKYLDTDLMLMPKTVVKNVICFRALCNYGAKVGVNHNAVSLKCWGERQVKDSQMRAQTYLNRDELQALYDMSLTGDRERVRDMFVFGTLLCQRYSDYMSLFKDNFSEPLPDGTKCCRLTQRKTGTDVVIPFYDIRMEAICNKYGYNFPHNREVTGEGKDRYRTKRDGDYTIQAFNRYLKDIMHELSQSVPSLNETFATVLTAGEHRSEAKYRETHNGADLFQRNDRGKVVRAKWDIITAHSARRSGITELYEKGVLTSRQIMNVSGHATESIFLHYIKTGADDEAMATAQALKG